MRYDSPFWQRRAFELVMGSALSFVTLTLIAMFFYPGGSATNPNTQGYSFFENFFSDLGWLVTPSGAANLISAALFFVALILAGSGLMLFFLAIPQFFQDGQWQRLLSTNGSALGVVSGACFVGLAFTPPDLFLHAHYQFAFWAFRLFPLAILFYVGAIFQHPSYPRQLGWALVFFFVLLAGYIWLLEFGPSPTASYLGQLIQVTGQKVIVYAAIFSISLQAWGAIRIQNMHAQPAKISRSMQTENFGINSLFQKYKVLQPKHQKSYKKHPEGGEA